MNKNLNANQIKRYSRQIILKNVGAAGQKEILKSKVLIIGAGGLGCPVADYLSRAGVGKIGIIDFDRVDISNIHRQSIFTSKDVGKHKVEILKKRLNNINPDTKIQIFKKRLVRVNISKILSKFDIIVDGTDNFNTKFLINEYAIKLKKYLVVGAISKFDGHIFSFNFHKKENSCLKCFYQSDIPDEVLNCETDGILGPVAGVVGNLQANEVLKNILKVKNSLNNSILILNLLNLKFRKTKFYKKKNCICKIK